MVQNFRLFKDLKPSVDAKKDNVLNVLGFEGSSPRHFRIKFKTHDLLETFKRALDGAVAGL